jgi:hypothetical protein
LLPDLEQFKKVGEMARKAVEAALPINWRELNRAEQEAAEVLAMEKGICVVWAPSAPIVRALVSAEDDAELERILLENQTRSWRTLTLGWRRPPIYTSKTCCRSRVRQSRASEGELLRRDKRSRPQSSPTSCTTGSISSGSLVRARSGRRKTRRTRRSGSTGSG